MALEHNIRMKTREKENVWQMFLILETKKEIYYEPYVQSHFNFLSCSKYALFIMFPLSDSNFQIDLLKGKRKLNI